MDFTFLLKGTIIGFALAIPIGPIGITCIRKTLTEGRLRGLIIGAGAATADLFYGSVAAFGLTAISDILDSQRIWIRLAGGIFLLFLGLRMLRARTKVTHTDSNRGIIRSYFTTILLTLTNPITVFAFIAVFASFGFAGELRTSSAVILVTGIFIGSCLWFLFLSTGASFFRKKLDFTGMRWVHRISGILVIISGLIAMATLL